MQKIKDIDFFLPEILMNKELCSLIGGEHISVWNYKNLVSKAIAYFEIN